MEQVGNVQVLLFIHAGGTINFTQQLRNINMSDETDMIDASAGPSNYRQYIMGLSDGTMDVDIVFNGSESPAGTTDLKLLRRLQGSTHYGEMGSATGMHKIIREALIATSEYDGPYDDLSTLSLSIQFSGTPVDSTW